jgi:hypothetical protein
MSIIGSELLLGAAGAGGYEIERSLRFNSSDSAYLSGRPASAGNRKTWTCAGWVKRSNYQLLHTYSLHYGISGGNDNDWTILFNGTSLRVEGSNHSRRLHCKHIQRLQSAWYHLVV